MTAAFPYMPERITTTLDDLDFGGLVERLRRVDALLATCTPGGMPTQGESSFSSPQGPYFSFRKRSDGIMLRSDPRADMSAMTMLETDLPTHGSASVPHTVDQARVVVARWLAMLSLPRFRSWGCQSHGDDPCDAIADHAASVLVAHNPKAANEAVHVPVPNHYRPSGPITIDRKPVFAKAISESLIARMPVMARISEGERHDYNIGVPTSVWGRCGEIDPIARLRALADTAHVAKPLLKAGLKAGS